MTTSVSEPSLPLSDYRRLIALDQPFRPLALPADPAAVDDAVRRALTLLAADRPVAASGVDPARLIDAAAHADAAAARQLLAAVLTVRGPGARSQDLDACLDALLGAERDARPTVDAASLPPVGEALAGSSRIGDDTIALWRGDITTLVADAIVNAANNALLGCRRPGHACIDNAVHAAAGPRLRDDCAAIIEAQGGAEATGAAKITRGYHLPAGFVLHTVGPIVAGPLTAAHGAALTRSYRACLDAASSLGAVRTVAFCSISTGVFGYPSRPAASVAITAVRSWLAEHPGRFDRVVFDVFSAAAHAAYADVLGSGGRDR